MLCAQIGQHPPKKQARTILAPEPFQETSGENAPICVAPLVFFSERLEDNVPTSTFPCEGPRPTVETLGSPAEVFDERNVVFLLLQPHCVAEHGGRRQKLGQTCWLLPRYQQAVRCRDFGILFHRFVEKSLG